MLLVANVSFPAYSNVNSQGVPNLCYRPSPTQRGAGAGDFRCLLRSSVVPLRLPQPLRRGDPSHTEVVSSVMSIKVVLPNSIGDASSIIQSMRHGVVLSGLFAPSAGIVDRGLEMLGNGKSIENHGFSLV